MMGPKFTQRDTDDAVAAIRKVYPAVMISAGSHGGAYLESTLPDGALT
jgi:hypothetical protein